MADETSTGSAGASPRRRHSPGSLGEQSPLQARAAFLKNRGWESVISFNRAACERGRAQHGFNSETQETLAREWEAQRAQVFSLNELLEFLRQCHRRAPFLFFNGNTFADIGRQVSDVLFADLPAVRRREVTSAIAHYISGVLDRENMVAIVESLWHSADLKPGDRVKTFRGSLRGVIVRKLPDGRVAWRPDRSSTELIALPESLVID